MRREGQIAEAAPVIGDELAAPVTIAVLDSGWTPDPTEPAVLPPLKTVGDTERLEPDVSGDALGHGTLCTRVLLATFGRVRVHPIKIFDDRLTCSPLRLLSALRAVSELAPGVVNLSLAAHFVPGREYLYHACEELRARGCIVVAAEDNGTRGGLPAIFDNVLSVNVDASPAAPPISAPEGLMVDVRVQLGLPVQVADGSSVALTSNSLATAMVSGLVARARVERGISSLGELRTALREDLSLWQEWSLGLSRSAQSPMI